MPIAPHFRTDLDLANADCTRVDATGDAEIERQVAEDADTAPLSTPEEMLARGRRIVPEAVEDVRALRMRLGLTQDAFAARFGFSVDAIRQYESHRRIPTGAVRTLLRVIARQPDAVVRALADRP
jgi:putative transcriptional regulator